MRALEEMKQEQGLIPLPFTPKGMQMREEILKFKSKMLELGFKKDFIKINFR